MSRRWLRVGAFGMAVVLAGCASAPLKPAVEAQAVDSLEAPAPAECLAKAGSGWSAEPATPPACPTAVAESTTLAEDN